MPSRLIPALFTMLSLSLAPLMAQETGPVNAPDAPAANSTTLEDILARQRGEAVPRENRDPESAASQAAGMLGTLGNASDSLLWEDLRFGTADITTQAQGPAAGVLVQDGGMRWQLLRNGPVRIYGGYLLLGTIGLLFLFYLLRGKIRIDGGRSGEKIERFKAVERFAHWLLAGSFILLGATGLITLLGRTVIIPLLGHEANAIFASASKWIHNNVAWAFMLALVMVFVFWVVHNLPSRTDLVWMAKGGGLFSKNSHPPAKKFNAGQKLIFWSVIILGGSISASGLSLLFPFEFNLFAATFAKLNALGVPGLLGVAEFPAVLGPHEEMQFAHIWHTIVSFALMAIVIAHIYIGSVGMEGAYDAMGSGQVDVQWAREHHSLWVEEMERKGKAPAPETQPAE